MSLVRSALEVIFTNHVRLKVMFSQVYVILLRGEGRGGVLCLGHPVQGNGRGGGTCPSSLARSGLE